VIGRVVRFRGELGVVTAWEPLGPAMTDARVRLHDGDIWVSSRELAPADDQGPLPARDAAIAAARAERRAALLVIRSGLVREIQERTPWPGCDFGKALIGRAIDAALAVTS